MGLRPIYILGGGLIDFSNLRVRMRAVLLACVSNVEGSARLLNVCGQTVRNHLKRLLQINFELVESLRRLGASLNP
jgi:hypothetical protein